MEAEGEVEWEGGGCFEGVGGGWVEVAVADWEMILGFRVSADFL